ncbi:MAG: M18 family aminopeptidase [Defluviitaleaceae bacterium]|nr:M18 family aminopeptidase [Defluviitaleaceae bacterium]
MKENDLQELSKDIKEKAKELINFIYDSPSPYHLVSNASTRLEKNGYKYLCPKTNWKIESGQKYYTTKDEQTIAAFELGQEPNKFNIIGAHTDSPTFKIKPKHIIVEQNYIKLNTEVYGGPIFNTWLDRPLSVAGYIVDKNLKRHLLKIEKPILIIPNLCIHFNRDINKGYEYNAQDDMNPILAFVNEKLESENYLLNILAKELSLGIEDILDFELFLYEYEKGSLIGVNEEFISSTRLDDAWMAFAGLEALLNANNVNGINVLVLFSHEEIGSQTAGGANSTYFREILERINIGLGHEKEELFKKMNNSFAISADLAHAVHPNQEKKHDKENRPILTGGPVIKYSAAQKYTTTAYSAAVFKKVCELAGVPVQKFVNKSDVIGGSTIAAFISRELGIQVVDMGSAILAMHSIRELGATIDNEYTIKAFTEFYQAVNLTSY